ncbi:type III secretion system protein SsaQ [Yersinia aldovae]|uniref:YscQ/HrcQ family type III secretion apparatus protein n=1 Tax=Yersinia aldovae TaxID=29483 RepID=UPI0005E5E496|nr:YscQ/HrcQ family type III secretion apparatus protein [Yersinia aldovae]CNJ53414.1 type III secretion system protein SsaQ [Yersinia aldovae]
MSTMTPSEGELAKYLPVEGVSLGALHIVAQQWTVAQPGVAFAVTLGGTECDIWLPQGDWQTWCETMIGSSDSNAIDPQLLAGVAEWGLSPLLAASDAVMANPSGYPRDCSSFPQQLALTFSWQIEQHRFRALLFGWPPAYFLSLIPLVKTTVRSVHVLPPIAFACYAGWCSLSLSELRGLNMGDGVRMQPFGHLRAGECILLLSAGVAARVSFAQENNMQISELVQDVESLLMEERDDVDNPPPLAVSIDDLPQILLVEVGQVDISLGALRALRVGDLLPVAAQFGGEVKLRLNGRVLGAGELVGCGDSFLVRINRWYLSPAEVAQTQGDTVNT